MNNQYHKIKERDLEDIIIQFLEKQNEGNLFLKNAYIKKFKIHPDIYAPTGIRSLGLEGETIIEIKHFLSYSDIDRIKYFLKETGKDLNLLVVYLDTSLSDINSFNAPGSHKIILFISLKDLLDEKIKFGVKEEKEEEKEEEEEEEEDTKETSKDDSIDSDWKSKRDDLMLKAGQVVNQNCNALFLGAGVSRSAGMPSWEELLKGLLSEAGQLNTETLSAFKEMGSQILEECDNSYLIMGRYLENIIHLKNKNFNFPFIIREHLYNQGEHNSDLLTCIADIANLKKTDEILTYNFDDIVEQNLSKSGLVAGKDYTSVSKDAEISSKNILPIYHVHGILPQEGPVDEVVFSENTFHSRYQDVYHWSNIEQLHALTRKHCFFIGLSMSDPNLRRLLDFARKINRTNDIPHYAFLQRTELKNFCIADVSKLCKYVHISDSLIDKNKQREIYDLNYTTIEHIYKELGINVIWYEDYHELPELISKVFGLGFKLMETDKLLSKVEDDITKIKKLEDDLPKYNSVNTDPKVMEEVTDYSNKHSKEYRALISEVNNILKELQTRIPNNLDTVKKYHSMEVPDYSNANGLGDFFEKIYDVLSTLLTKDNK